MLEDEGIQFEANGMKILDKHFINEEGTKDCTKKRKAKTKVTKQPTNTTNNKTASKVSATSASDEITEEILKKEILQLLNKRAPGKTC